ncbi:DNA primase [Streptomyces sp. NPDC001351]|uniref:DNA primase n=1 Tax=Streptomyces sp. NPDC001351 TaxID=3364564 RepID=UPI0036CB8DB1
MNRVGLGLAVGAGYVLGRTKKMKMAFAVGSLVAGKRMHLSPRALADLVSQQLQNNPQFKEIGDQLREDLRGVGKAASGAMVERQMDALADRLHGRTAEVRDQLSGATDRAKGLVDDEDEAQEDENEESGEAEGEDSRGEYDDEEPTGEEHEDEERDVDEREDEEEPPSDEAEGPRKTAKKTAKKAAKKAPAKKTAAKRSPAKKAPAKKAASKQTTAKKSAAKRTAARRTAPARGGSGGTRARRPKGGGER